MINWIKGKLIHKKNSKDHFPVETYAGMSVIGYTCNGCGYRWYEERVRNKSH